MANINAYAQTDFTGSIDQLVAKMRSMELAPAPGADLLGSHIYDDLMADVIVAKHVGRGVVDGVECEHLAFRDLDIDWQLWVEVGARPIPRKYVITSKSVGAAPRYTLRIKNWTTDAPSGAEAFVFNPPSGASRVAMDALLNTDEVPEGTGARSKEMMNIKGSALRYALAILVAIGCLFASESAIKSGSFVALAHAVIGRPLTPVSYAGVARRSAVGVGVGVGVAVGVAATAPVVVAPACAQVVNVYGQITTVCR